MVYMHEILKHSFFKRVNILKFLTSGSKKKKKKTVEIVIVSCLCVLCTKVRKGTMSEGVSSRNDKVW